MTRRQVLQTGAIGSILFLSGCTYSPFDERTTHGQLFLENRTESPIEIALSVTDESENSNRIIHSEYQIPMETVLQFEDVLAPDHTYNIQAEQPDIPDRAHEQLVVEVETCAADDPADQMDVSILAGHNGPDIIEYGCDAPYEAVGYLTYTDPSEYETGTITGPLPTPRPS